MNDPRNEANNEQLLHNMFKQIIRLNSIIIEKRDMGRTD